MLPLLDTLIDTLAAVLRCTRPAPRNVPRSRVHSASPYPPICSFPTFVLNFLYHGSAPHEISGYRTQRDFISPTAASEAHLFRAPTRFQIATRRAIAATLWGSSPECLTKSSLTLVKSCFASLRVGKKRWKWRHRRVIIILIFLIQKSQCKFLLPQATYPWRSRRWFVSTSPLQLRPIHYDPPPPVPISTPSVPFHRKPSITGFRFGRLRNPASSSSMN